MSVSMKDDNIYLSDNGIRWTYFNDNEKKKILIPLNSVSTNKNPNLNNKKINTNEYIETLSDENIINLWNSRVNDELKVFLPSMQPQLFLNNTYNLKGGADHTNDTFKQNPDDIISELKDSITKKTLTFENINSSTPETIESMFLNIFK